MKIFSTFCIACSNENMNSVVLFQREASEIFKRKSELQNKIATMKNNERVSKTPERSMQQLTQR